jgi:hypothetical protein
MHTGTEAQGAKVEHERRLEACEATLEDVRSMESLGVAFMLHAVVDGESNLRWTVGADTL